MSNQKEEKDAIIMFADIKKSTEFAHSSPNVYYTLIEEFQKMAKGAIDKYCIDKNLSKDKIYSYGQGDEVMVIIYNMKMESAAKFALELSIHLKLNWRNNPYIRKKREAYSKLSEKPPIDLRIGIGDGKVVKFTSPWNNLDTFAGVAINIAKKIETSAECAEEILIVVSEGVKNYYERLPSKNIEFDIPIPLPESEAKRISEHFPLWVYPVKKYPDSLEISKEVIKEKKTYLGYFDSGYAKSIAGDYEGAIKDYTEAIKLNSEDADAYYNRGLAYHYKGLYDEAIQDYNKAIGLNPKYADVYYNRGLVYGEKKEYDKAIEDYTKAIDLDPKDAEAYNERGLAYLDKGLYDEAIKDYNKAIELNPKFVAAYYNRGLAYHYKGLYDEAIKDYNKAIELNPKFVKVYSNRGTTYYRKGEYDEAIEDYNKAIELNPKDVVAYANIGYVYFDMGNYDKAKENFSKATQINDKYADAYCGLGITYYKLGKIDLAKETYKKAIELDNRYAGKINELIKERYFYSEPQLQAIKELLKEMGY